MTAFTHFLGRCLHWVSGLGVSGGGGALPCRGGSEVSLRGVFREGLWIGLEESLGQNVRPSLSLAGIRAALSVAGLWLGWLVSWVKETGAGD